MRNETSTYISKKKEKLDVYGAALGNTWEVIA